MEPLAGMTGPLGTLALRFALLSLFAIGGANAAIPEMHRLAVQVEQWMNDRQFADMYAISQLSPGPNVIIVTLIGYHGDDRTDLRVRILDRAGLGALQG
jgi:chromate transporter